MARKTQLVTITADGRDKGKVFVLREMRPRQSLWWGARLMTAMAKSGVQIPDDIAKAGLEGLAVLGVKFTMSAIGLPEVKPLMDELFESCIAIVPDPAKLEVMRGAGGIGAIIDDDIEELTTLTRLFEEALVLHLDFLPPAALSLLKHFFGTAGTGASSQST